MSQIDLEPAASEVARLLDGVDDDRLDAPTPCPDYTVAAMLDHLMGLALAFTAAARKEPDLAPTGPVPSAADLDPAWRTELPERLDAMVEAWRDPDAWSGTTAVGGVTMPAPDIGAVGLDELVLHGWDLARATGQRFEVDEASAQVVHGFTTAMSAPGQEQARTGLFGPVVAVAADASTFDRALGLSGRDPGWRPPG